MTLTAGNCSRAIDKLDFQIEVIYIIFVSEKLLIAFLIILFLISSLGLNSWLTTAFHELGHTLASLTVKQPIKSVRIWSSSSSPFKFQFVIGGIKLSLSLKYPRGESRGFTEQLDKMLPVNSAIFFALGGSLTNFLVFLFSFGFLYQNASSLLVHRGGTYILVFFMELMFFNLAGTTVNLIPFPGNDGWHIKNLLSYRRRSPMVIYHTFPGPIFIQLDGFYREFPIKDLKNRNLRVSLPTILVLVAFLIFFCSLKH